MASCYDGIFRCPYEGNERESSYSDSTDCTRCRICDADGAIVTYGIAFGICRNKIIEWTCLRTRERLQRERKKRCGPNLQQDWRIHYKRCRMEVFHPKTWGLAWITPVSLPVYRGRGSCAYFLSTSLMYAENTRAFISALPAAKRTLFGCQSMERTVDLIGFLRSFETHQLLSSSNEQIAIALITTSQSTRVTPTKQQCGSHLAPLATANLFSNGLHRTKVAARLMLSNTNVGFHSVRPVWGSGV